MSFTKEQILNLIAENPIEIGHWVGFNDLTELHNDWLKRFLFCTHDQTLQAHRGSYKTTTLSLFLPLNMIISPNQTMLFFRKTDNDVVEVIKQVQNILRSGCIQEIVRVLYGKDLVLVKASQSSIQTNLPTHIRGSSQLSGLGIGTSITGKHADIVVTDDIVNINDRVSRAERENTKLAYQELQNIKNRGGRLINTGTPWHKEDAFTLMPNPAKWDCYQTGLMSPEQIEDLRQHMSPSLFAANYELRHIAAENIIFKDPIWCSDEDIIMNGIAHVDAAFYGEDYTAFTIMNRVGGKYYIFGKVWRKHVEDCYQDIFDLYHRFLCSKLYLEKNADKGYVSRDLRTIGIRTVPYNESMNKHIKIVTYLKGIWPETEFVKGTDQEYVEMITDYTEDAEHDDAPDSAACLARIMYPKANKEKRRTQKDHDYLAGLIGGR